MQVCAGRGASGPSAYVQGIVQLQFGDLFAK